LGEAFYDDEDHWKTWSCEFLPLLRACWLIMNGEQESEKYIYVQSGF